MLIHIALSEAGRQKRLLPKERSLFVRKGVWESTQFRSRTPRLGLLGTLQTFNAYGFFTGGFEFACQCGDLICRGRFKGMESFLCFTRVGFLTSQVVDMFCAPRLLTLNRST